MADPICPTFFYRNKDKLDVSREYFSKIDPMNFLSPIGIYSDVRKKFNMKNNFNKKADPIWPTSFPGYNLRNDDKTYIKKRTYLHLVNNFDDINP